MARPGFEWIVPTTLPLTPLFAAGTIAGGFRPSRGEAGFAERKEVASNFFSDQKMIWTFPARLVTGRGLVPTFAVAGATAALVPLDAPGGRYFRRNSGSFDGFNRALSENHTTAGVS